MGKIGIMGGTFDPVHNGHLLIGKQALVEYGLDKIWYMPSGQPPHKRNHAITRVEDRCAMLKLAIQQEPGFVFSDFEVSRDGYSYTAQTLKLLRQAYPEHEFYFIVGADSLYEIETWNHPELVVGQIPILAAQREYPSHHLSMEEQIAYLNRTYNGHIEVLHCREVDISSEEIRNRTGKGESLADYVPEQVASYICQHKLYHTPNQLGGD